MINSETILYNLIPCLLSAIASLTFLFCFIKFESISVNKPMKLLAIFQLFDIILSLNTLIPHRAFSNATQICKLQGFIEQFFSTSEVIWISWFSYFVYRKICLNKSNYDTIDINTAILITFAITSPISILYALLGYYGESGYWCWVKYDDPFLKFVLLEFLGSYVFMFISCGCGLYVTYKVFRKTSGNTSKIDWNIFRLQAYPVIMFFTYIFMFICRAYESRGKRCPEQFLNFSSTLINLIGFFNFIFLGFTKEFRSAFTFKVVRVVPLLNSQEIYPRQNY